MSKVHLLDDELINKIAAGEVVERPASVVKELVENAVDAGASQVEVELLDGGKGLISVRDNGAGMNRVDAIMAIKRHCTSKIHNLDDLFQVGTMGFRGEALASISAVSRFTMLTRTAECQIGSKIGFEDGAADDQDWNGDVGTQIAIKDIFYNVPARKAFLKSGSAEFAQCHELMQSLALSLPHVGFVLKHNGKEHLRVSPASASKIDDLVGEAALRQRSEDVLGQQKNIKFCYLHHQDKYGQVEALISPPGFERSTGKHIFMFVNGRYVKDRNIRFSILRGYHSHLLKGRFPVCVLHLTMDPSLVDVNVHPNKAEVRFQYGQEVQSLIAVSIRDRLRAGDWASPSFDDDQSSQAMPRSSSSPSVEAKRQDKSSTFAAPSAPASNSGRQGARGIDPLPRSASFGKKSSAIETDFDLSFKPDRGPTKPLSTVTESSGSRQPYTPPSLKTKVVSFEGQAEPKPSGLPWEMALDPKESPKREAEAKQDLLPWADMKFLGAFGKCYLFFEWADRLVVLDQHAFHERILYERLKRDHSILKQVQPLLMPEVISLSPSLVEKLKEAQEPIEKLGFRMSVMSSSEVELGAVPSLLKKADWEAVLSQLADSPQLQGSADEVSELAHDVLSTMACHAAVRAGEELPEAELEYLLNEAHDVDFYQNCPHGRPVVKIFKKSQIEGWFER
ncbi:DNA mismatch repair endonuclease MutL [Pseudobacteriovorax antillogorgiicola]|uniref:DNA mismatch repair protein MutL n=1 Tax=Pseudobacteriovorax antillogorgiicola TaxID=1513793 RepID=A0A1Y6BBB9_9BACT|nr:DNA mismatch repair endonuclease MutL [Pseudobacteriovorax antillogorgiicola]TCS58820.1 DNA mismatch repair protein MutL [Pseudobacteriovorax antillogorgiicola]SME94275.1 DNA mismatch repair protein MutL [Pseudobacteriovorax antillogorgiicola]